ncbi:HAD-IIIC family phosphatase [Streptomyces radicis]|uniref:HAD-IIIC family phosphatase n=1 Tax=Streptomyces radicis TaxID=1750517 RepID=A0A3A9VUU7_9ACTN|nr:HAD-IIIC family phosphatase [Streptomyces radicis]RKN04861.1 HAD-IIIC family phosphatase [Streptomyces radicis]RKN25371.1 HAD-IIIC family phosphatase [Streptomyces radicis]
MAAEGVPTVKCLVWDLDDTVWDGVVLEGDEPVPFPHVPGVLRALDERGILHAVVSRGDHDVATAHLEAHGLEEWFCAARIGWGAKSAALSRIADALNIGLDTVAFIDNDPAERAEVAAALPLVRCYPAEAAADLPERPEFRPAHVTAEAAGRRQLYRTEWRRRRAEEESGGDRRAFLASLDLVMEVAPATEADLARASELTVRTHQLNSTGLTYDEDELRKLAASPDHQVRLARLTDRFGDYGIIGLSVTELTPDDAVLRLLLMSCRVASRGVGGLLLAHLVREARSGGRRAVAHFLPTSVNRTMLVTLRFAGFTPVDEPSAGGAPLVLAVPDDHPLPELAGPARLLIRDA